MYEDKDPDSTRLNIAREAVQSFLVKKKRFASILFYATLIAEGVFLALMLYFMDFSNRLQWFMFFGFLFIYSPLILFSWHNAVEIDRLYYRLIDELKWGDFKNTREVDK
jgi:hypothetical protein